MNQFPISKRLEIKDLEIEICLEIGFLEIGNLRVTIE